MNHLKGVYILILLGILLSITITACSNNDNNASVNSTNTTDSGRNIKDGRGDLNMERVKLKSSDEVGIIGDYYPAEGDKGIILLHRLDKDRNDWKEFAAKLKENGFSSIAIDLRGHGESEGDWRSFSEKDFRNMVKDAKAAEDFMRKKRKDRMAVIGESIGANTAFNLADEDRDISAVILLSPGVNYRGISIERSAKEFDDRPLLVILSRDDPNYSTGLSAYNMITAPSKELKEYETGGHGTQIFDSTNLTDFLISWLDRNFH